MSKDINDYLGLPGINLGGLGIETGLDMNYLQGEGDEEAAAEQEDHESELDEDEDSGEEQGEGEAKEDEEEKIDTTNVKAKMKKAQNMEDAFAKPIDKKVVARHMSFGEGAQPQTTVARKRTATQQESYKIPILYRSQSSGVKYRLSEILFPRDPKVREANLAFNREHMKNKLISLNTEATKEIKRKLKESLKSRKETQLKTIREASMRLLLKDYLYLKSDLSKKENERIIKDIRNDTRMRQSEYKSVKEIKSYIERDQKLKELQEQKRQEQEAEEKAQLEKEKAEQLKGNRQGMAKAKEKRYKMNITFGLRKDNLLLTMAERAKGLNQLSNDLNFENKSEIEQGGFKEAKNGPEPKVEKDKKVEFRKFVPNLPDEELTQDTIEEIKAKADLSKLYPQHEFKPSNQIEAESYKFLEVINFNDWTTDTGTRTGEGDKKVRFDVEGTAPGTAKLPSQAKEEHKDNGDDLFAMDSPKAKDDESNDDDLFADDSPKDNKGTDKDKELDEFGDMSVDEDDPFALPTDKPEPAKPKLEKKEKSTVAAGDLFTKQLHFKVPHKQAKPKETSKFRYFGELKDADSIYQQKYENRLKKQQKLEVQKKVPFELKKTDKETVKMNEKSRLEDVKNKPLVEMKMFEKLSLYKFRNKELDKVVHFSTDLKQSSSYDLNKNSVLLSQNHRGIPLKTLRDKATHPDKKF